MATMSILYTTCFRPSENNSIHEQTHNTYCQLPDRIYVLSGENFYEYVAQRIRLQPNLFKFIAVICFISDRAYFTSYYCSILRPYVVPYPGCSRHTVDLQQNFATAFDVRNSSHGAATQ